MGHLDSPLPDALVYQHGFEAAGWAPTYGGRPWTKVRVLCGETVIGETAIPLARPDVAAAFGPKMENVGFALHCTLPEPLRATENISIRCSASYPGDIVTEFGGRTLRLSHFDYRQHGHGYVYSDLPIGVLKRNNIYGSGPPAPDAHHSVVELIMRYLKAGDSVLDVGCGIGAYARALEPLGILWTGCENRPDFVSTMREGGLNAVLAEDSLPFPNGAFDAAICIEVLEHVEDYESFLSEITRVVRGRVLFSVPNFGAIPVTAAFYAIPWHMLEADHKNFFTTKSLSELLLRHFARVETFEYGPLTLMQSLDGLPINNHVFAVADLGERVNGI